MSDGFDFNVPGGNGTPQGGGNGPKNNDDTEGSYKRLLGDKPITWFWLMQHYSKPNAAAYKAQKEARKAAKNAQARGNITTPGQMPNTGSPENQWNQQRMQGQGGPYNQQYSQARPGGGDQQNMQGAGNSWGQQNAQGAGNSWGQQNAQGAGTPWGQQNAQGTGTPWGQQNAQGAGNPWGQQNAQNARSPWGQQNPPGAGNPWGQQNTQNQAGSWNQNQQRQGGSGSSFNQQGAQVPGNMQSAYGTAAAASNHDGKTVVLNRSGAHTSNGRVIAMLECLNYDQTIEISSTPFFIGRDKSLSDLCLPENLHISARHAVINYNNGTFYITDLESPNHVFVNDVMIEPKKSVIISNNDRITLADEEFIFHKR